MPVPPGWRCQDGVRCTGELLFLREIKGEGAGGRSWQGKALAEIGACHLREERGGKGWVGRVSDCSVALRKSGFLPPLFWDVTQSSLKESCLKK